MGSQKDVIVRAAVVCGMVYGFCEGYSDLECGLMGSISAAMCIRQYGPPEIAEISCEELDLQLKKLVEMVAGK